MPTKKDARSRRCRWPDRHNPYQRLDEISPIVLLNPAASRSDRTVKGKNAPEWRRGEADERGDKEDAGGVTAREGPVIDSEGEAHALVVDGAGAADEVLDEADEEEVKQWSEKEAEDERVGDVESIGGGEREKGNGDGEPEASVAGDLEGFEKEAGDGEAESMDPEGGGSVERDNPAEDGRLCRHGGGGRGSVGGHRGSLTTLDLRNPIRPFLSLVVFIGAICQNSPSIFWIYRKVSHFHFLTLDFSKFTGNALALSKKQKNFQRKNIFREREEKRKKKFSRK